MCVSRLRVIGLSCGLAFCGIWIAAAAPAREWTDSSGKFKIEADFVSADNGVVTLKKSDGKTIHLSLDKLCDADRDFVKSQAAAPAGENPFDHNSPAPSPSKSSASKSSGGKSSAAASRPAAALPLPKGVDAAAVKQAEAGMNDLFKTELADAKTASKRAELAKQLLQVGKDTKDDAASQFVLFRKAAELAAAGADLETTLAAVEQLEVVFKLNALPLAVEALEILSRQPKVDHRAVAKAAEPLIDKALAADDFEAAAKLTNVMINAAKSAKDLAQIRAATARVAEIGVMREEQKKVAPAQEKLQTAPLDPEANRIVGRYLCFTKRDWEHGLPMLGLGDEESLKNVAIQDLKDNKTGNEMMALGDSWDALAHGARQGAAAKERADFWYRRALPLVSGVAKMKLEKRLGAAAAAVASNSGSTNSIGMKLVLIKPGEFEMGDSDRTDELLQLYPFLAQEGVAKAQRHHVRITRPYYLGACTVTVGQFRKFVESQNYRTDAERGVEPGLGWNEKQSLPSRSREYTWRNTGFPQTDEHPVVNVSWNDADAFCTWLSEKEHKKYRLPTSAEWEYACRAGTTTRFYFGDDANAVAAYENVADSNFAKKFPVASWAAHVNDDYTFTAPVGKFKPNPWGLYDMHGNVMQWCNDWDWGQTPHDVPQTVDPQGAPSGTNREQRGGSWYHSVVFGRSAARCNSRPTLVNDFLGFRVARTAD